MADLQPPGWLFLFATSGSSNILLALGCLVLGLIGFGVWTRLRNQWPWTAPQTD